MSGLNVAAPNTFAGKVVDENNKPVPGVWSKQLIKKISSYRFKWKFCFAKK